MVDTNWTMWMRPDVGRWSIGHLCVDTHDGVDYTICGMDYDSAADKQTGYAAEQFKCQDCADGRQTAATFRFTMPNDPPADAAPAAGEHDAP